MHCDVGAKLSVRELSNAICIFSMYVKCMLVLLQWAVLVLQNLAVMLMVTAIQSRFHELKALCVFFNIFMRLY